MEIYPTKPSKNIIYCNINGNIATLKRLKNTRFAPPFAPPFAPANSILSKKQTSIKVLSKKCVRGLCLSYSMMYLRFKVLMGIWCIKYLRIAFRLLTSILGLV